MRFGILGPVEVIDDHGRVVALGGPKQRSVLAILLLHAGEVVSSERLIDELWGERAPASAANTLQVYVSKLRKALGDGVLLTRGGGYVLQSDRGEVDVDRFQALLVAGRRALQTGDPRGAGESLREALGLWRGPPLSDFAYEPFAQGEIARLEEARLAALEDRIGAELALCEHGGLVGELEALVREYPLRERVCGQLMLALYRSGRQAEALDAYQRAREQLTGELGLEPGRELKALQAAILNQDPSLAPVALASGSPAASLSAGWCASSVQGSRQVRSGGPLDRERRQAMSSVQPQTRKMVTALVCELAGSTALGEQRDPEVLNATMNRYFAEVRATIERHGGIVDKFIGDAVMAVFGIPRVREDDALRALRAAAEIRDRLPGIAEEVGVALQSRIGINTGLVLAGGAENVATGDSVNLAARLQRTAPLGEILLGSETLRLVRDAVAVEPLEPLALTDNSGSVPAFRLVGLDPLAPGFARRFDVPLVGRQRELSLLREAWDQAVGGSGCHLFTVLGEAGAGKSRLVAELLTGVGDATAVLRGRCLHYGEGITFWPLIEALTALDGEAQPVLELLDSGSVATPEELFLEVRRLLESLALERPVIVHVDDLQWAEPTLLDLLDHVVDLSRGAPILLLCAARLELLEHRPGWGGGKLNATTTLLEPLGASDCETLIDQLADDLDPEARARVISASEGNPLFLQEMVALIRERGTVAVPATIQALLAERLERLASEERAILECGAVEGEVFHRRAVLALAGEPVASKLDSLLPVLVRKELIRPHPALLQDDDAFRFRHLLIRDAAYDALPKATRAELHQRFAGWLEGSPHGVIELDEIAGWHLEQAVRYRHELGRELDTALARRAAAHLHAAGRRASERTDVAAARNLFGRALKLAPAGEPSRARIGVDLAEQLIEDGDYARADELLSAAERDPDASALAVLTRFEWLIRVAPHEATQTIDAKLPGILRQLAETGDQRAIAKAHLAAYWVHKAASRHTPAGEQARLAAEHARKAGDESLRSQALGWYAGSIIYGPQHTCAAVQALEEIEREEPGPYLATRLAFRRGQLARLEGHFNASRQLIQCAIDGFHALGMPQHVAGCEQDLANTELAAGDPDAALAALLRSDEILAERGERSLRSTTQALLAQAHELIGNHQAALVALDLVDELDDPEDVLAHAITHSVRARLALAAGDSDAAERWARSAVEHALLSDNTVLQADATLQLARVLVKIGQRDNATTQAHAALDLFLTKGDVPGADNTRALLRKLATPA